MPAAHGNPKGHYEDLDFHDFHEEVFRAHRIRYGGLKKAPKVKLDDASKIRLKSIIEEKSRLHAHWGWKDPRTCLFLDVYRELVPQAKSLVLFRSCDEVVTSLWNRKQKTKKGKTITEAKGWSDMKLIGNFTDAWIQHNEMILKHLAEIQPELYYVTSLYHLKLDWNDVLKWLNGAGAGLMAKDFNDTFESKFLTAQAADEIKFSKKHQERITAVTTRFEQYLSRG